MKTKLCSGLLAALALPLALGACGEGDKTSVKTSTEVDGVKTTVEIRDAWCRPTPNGAQTAACYLTVKSSAANRMTGADTPMATSVEIHDMTTADGVMRMTPLPNGLPLAADEAVKLAPGGRHLMLLGLTGPLSDGTAVPLTLTFEATPAMTVQAPVRQPQ